MIIKLDKLGRFVIPKAIREMIGVKPNEKIELNIEGKKVFITKGE
jgi:AbrB family looped-hinge helix DNA binding protein